MVKLSRQEVEKELALESFRLVSDEELQAAMSYSPEMLDINELFEKTYVTLDDVIDLGAFPDIKVIQASSQDQIDMLLSASKKQIEAIHLSNDEPVGWDDKYNMENSSRMDRQLDLRDYENLKAVEAHFYLNTDLEQLLLPKSANRLKFQHSKLPALKLDHTDRFEEIIINRALMNNIKEGENISINDSIIDGEHLNFYDEDSDEDEYSITDEFEQIQAEDGMYELKVQGKVVLKSEQPFEIQEVANYGFTTHYNNSEDKYFSRVGINGEVFALSDNELYRMYNDKEGGIGRHVDKVIFENTAKDERIEAYSYLGIHYEGFGGNVNLREGYSEVRGRLDVGRGYTPVETSLFLVRDGKVLPETICTISSEMGYCGDKLYKQFMNNIKEKGITLSAEEKMYKDNFLRRFARMKAVQGYDKLYNFDKDMFLAVKDTVTPKMRRNYILDHIKDEPKLIELVPEMITKDNLSVKDLLTIENISKQEESLRHISSEVLKGNENAKDLLKFSLSSSRFQDNAVDVSNIPFLFRLAAQSGENLSEEENIYGQLFERLSNPDKANPQEASSALYHSVKTLLELGVEINRDTFKDGYSGTEIWPNYRNNISYIIKDPAARLAVKANHFDENKDALRLYQLLIDNVKSQKDINNLTLYTLLATPKGKKSAKLEILSPKAVFEDIEMGDAISMGRIDVCRHLYEKGRKPTDYDLSNLQAHADGKITFSGKEETKLPAAEFIKFATLQKQNE